MDAAEFVQDFLAHRGKYDPVKAHEYYLRTRNLNPRKRVEEDEVPEKSPSGAKIIDFDGKNGGRATYSDGSTFDGDGWNKSGHDHAQRVQAAQEKLMVAKSEAKKIKDPAFRRTREARLAALQRQLDGVKAKLPKDAKPKTIAKPASTKKPVLRRASSRGNA